MTREETVAFFDRRQAATARHDVAALGDLYADDCVLESPLAGGTVTGRAVVEQVSRKWFTAFPDVVTQPEELLVDGDRVVLISTLAGTDTGGFLGLAPTGKSFRLPIVYLCALKDRRIVHERRIYDFTGLLVQIGNLKAKPV